MTQVFETPGSVTLRIRIPTGRVLVETTDAPRTEIELEAHGRRGEDALDQIDVTHDERPGRHVVSIEQRDRISWGPFQISWGGGVEVRVRCPVGTELELSGASTEFRADGRYGKVSARTASGNIRLGDVEGKLEVKTASGDLELDRIESDNASLVTVSGDVAVENVAGRLSAGAGAAGGHPWPGCARAATPRLGWGFGGGGGRNAPRAFWRGGPWGAGRPGGPRGRFLG